MRKGRIGAAVALGAVVAFLAWWLGHKGGGGVHATEAAAPAAVPAHVEPAAAAPAHARLGGRVTDDHGAPIEGAIVRLAPQDGDGDTTAARTGADGTYAFDDVAPGRFGASAAAAGFLAKDGGTFALAPGERRTIDFTLAPGGRPLAGTVTDATGGPIGGALIEAARERGVLAGRAPDVAATFTDDAGHYALTVAEGAYDVSASHAEYVGASKRVLVGASGGAADFALVPGGAIEGIVEDAATGQGVAGAHVDVTREALVRGMVGATTSARGLASATTDGAGHFRVAGLEPGTIAIRATAPGRASKEPTVVPLGVAEQVTGVIVVVQAAPSIRGTIVDERGQPAPGTTAYLAAGPSIDGAKADATGAFAFEGVEPGTYQLTAGGPGYRDSAPPVAVTIDRAPVGGVKLVVRRGPMIRGHVDPPQVADVSVAVDPTADPATIDLRALTRDRVATEAGPDGTFALGPVDPGTVDVVARAADGKRGKVTVTATDTGADGVVIHLDEGATLAGRVSDGKDPVAGAVVSVRAVKAHARTQVIVDGVELTAERAPTGADGRYAIAGLAAGDYELQVLDEHGGPLAWRAPADTKLPTAPIAITLAAHDRKTADLEIERPHGVIKGVVIGADGKPVADAWVSASRGLDRDLVGGPPGGGPDGSGDLSRTMVVSTSGAGDEGLFGGVPPVLTGPDGRFELTHLRRGAYDVIAEGAKGQARGSQPNVEPDADITIRLAPLTELTGTVTANGAPVSDFTVELTGAAARTQRFLAADGHFTIARVDPGAYDVQVTAKEGTGHTPVTIAAGQHADVQVALIGHGRITGKVVDASGAPVANAPVVTVPDPGKGPLAITINGPPETTAADGTFAIDAEPGKRLLIVLGGGGPLVHQPVEVKSGDAIDLGTLVAQPRAPRPK